VSERTVDLSQLDGKPIGLLAWAETPDGEDECAVYAGTARVRGGGLWIEWSGDEPDFEVRSEWLERIRLVDAELGPMLLGAQYVLSLRIGNLPESGAEGYLPTGLKWPE
jgi:hypothetical protein